MRVQVYMALVSAVLGSAIHVPAGANDVRRALESVRANSPVAARYEVRLTDRSGRELQKRQWYFRRDVNRIETVASMGEAAEIWDRDERGEITLRRVFRADRRVVEYLPRELRALSIEPSWDELSALVAPRDLGSLKRTGTITLPQGIATVHKGVLNGRRVEIWWLEEKALPTRVVKQVADGRVTLTLKAMHAQPPADWPMPRDNELSEYLHVDVADFGDMEHDPFVRKVERLDALSGAFGTAKHHSHAPH